MRCDLRTLPARSIWQRPTAKTVGYNWDVKHDDGRQVHSGPPKGAIEVLELEWARFSMAREVQARGPTPTGPGRNLANTYDWCGALKIPPAPAP